MKRAAVLLLALVALLGLLVPTAGALAAKPPRKPKQPRGKTFETCHHGCPYRSIQKAVDAAGAYAWKHRKTKVTVGIKPGRYAEGVVLAGGVPGEDFDGMTIEGTESDRHRTVLAGRGAEDYGIEAIGVGDLVLANLWARGFRDSGFFVHDGGRRHDCDGYTMSNLLASGNRVWGLAATGCLGGSMLGSAGYHDGDAVFHVGETPCDSAQWSIYDGTPCQARPQPTLLRDDEARESLVGYSGTNAKYVAILESAFYDNGAGILSASLEDTGPAPAGWNVFERNDVFWNNYDPFLAGSAFEPVEEDLGELDGQALASPTGVGIVLDGTDHDLVRGNHVFGNYKWGIASFSGPGEAAKNIDNEIVGNVLGRLGADPNGEYDFFGDATGGGNCWGANSAGATFAPGNGKLPQGQIYPECPQAPAPYATAKSTNLTAGLQAATLTEAGGRPSTLVGYLGGDPSQDQQCSWVRRVPSHPPFQLFVPAEVTPAPGELTCDRG